MANPPATNPSAILTWPNLLTLGRMILAPILVGSFYIEGIVGLWLGFAAFSAAALTDFIDGWLARRLNQDSALGRILDPIADKLIVAAALVLLTSFDRASPLAVAAILSREFLISGLREALPNINSLHVTWLAKWKTTTQMLAILLLLVAPAAPGAITSHVEITGDGILWLAVILTWVTGFVYVRAMFNQLVARRTKME